ncbi:MAG: ankyrin repeat domain-containing protein [Campylobacterota bacterium]|nr:ankyrin repeat domain-containing protein [Campylobacterota bacterium]
MTNIETLLKNGADVNTKDQKGFSLLMCCSKNNDINSINTLLSYGVKINEKDTKGHTALDYAVAANNLKIVKMLVENGGKVNDSSYMLAINKKLKDILHYFDSLDSNKQIFLKKRRV